MKASQIVVTHRKLGRHKAWGLAHPDGRIEIDSRATGKHKLELLIHEFLHVWEWVLPEQVVDSLAKALTTFLHKHNVRIIEPDTKP